MSVAFGLVVWGALAVVAVVVFMARASVEREGAVRSLDHPRNTFQAQPNELWLRAKDLTRSLVLGERDSMEMPHHKVWVPLINPTKSLTCVDQDSEVVPQQKVWVCGGQIIPIPGMTVRSAHSCDEAYAMDADWVVEIIDSQVGVVDVTHHLNDGYCGFQGSWGVLKGGQERRVDCQRPMIPAGGQKIATPPPLTTHRAPRTTPSITILIIADNASQKHYSVNIATFECYAHLQGYRIEVLGISPTCLSSTLGFFFQKQCVVHEQMVGSHGSEWFMVLDADVAVVNPNHRIEDYLDDSKEVVHFLRFHNNEVMAGGYIVHNAQWGRSYLKEWSGLHPGAKEQHGYSGMNADNGALHWMLLHRLAGPMTPGWTECEGHGRSGKNYAVFVTCFHQVAARTGCSGLDWSHIAILPHGQAWMYDGWVTHYKWGDRTFMHHAMKNPPIASHNGRIMPSFECSTFKTRTDEYRVEEAVLNAEFSTTRAHERAKHRVRGWNETSCLQRELT